MGLAISDPVQAAVSILPPADLHHSSAFASVSRLPAGMQPIARGPRSRPRSAPLSARARRRRAFYRARYLTNAAIRFGIAWVVIMVLFTFLAVRQYRKA